jgi:iron(III) transport system permease protein
LTAQLRLLDPLLFESASVFQPSFLRRMAVIYFPLVAPGLAAGIGLVAALTMGELCATLLVIPPGQSTLVLRIYNYLHYGATDTVARLCLVLTLSVLIVGGAAATISSIWARVTTMREVES